MIKTYIITWINFNPSTDKLHAQSKCMMNVGSNYLSTPKLQRLHSWNLDKYFHPAHYNGCDYLSMPGFKLHDVLFFVCHSLLIDVFCYFQSLTISCSQSIPSSGWLQLPWRHGLVSVLCRVKLQFNALCAERFWENIKNVFADVLTTHGSQGISSNVIKGIRVDIERGWFVQM